MCELFGMSARKPTAVSPYLELLGSRGGGSGPHADGWGIAWYDGRAAEVYKQPEPAAHSRCFWMLAETPRASALVVAHLRKANPPEVGRAWANTHPFEREMGGHAWVFAHNGKLPGIEADPRFATRRFRPVGDTDSERAFCFLMERLTDEVPAAPGLISSGHLEATLRDAVATLSTLGELNFLLADGFHLVAYATGRLHLLERPCRTDACEDAAVLLATEPLTAEEWTPLPRETIHVFAMGRRLVAPSRRPPAMLCLPKPHPHEVS
jgi:predicted glutamine amidotransferase